MTNYMHIPKEELLAKKRKITHGFDELARFQTATTTHTGRIAMGIRPSGQIHVGNLATILNAFIIADKVGAKGVDLTICDIDQPNKCEPGFKKHYHVLYKHLADQHGCHENAALHSGEAISNIAEQVKDIVEQRIGRGFDLDVTYLSDITSQLEFRKALMGLFKDRYSAKHVKRLFNGGSRVRTTKSFKDHKIFLPCHDCGTTPHGQSDIETNRDNIENSRIVGARGNYDCGTCTSGLTLTPLKELDREIAVHYCIDPIRDVSLTRYEGDPVRVHIFGGDYKHNPLGLQQAEVVHDLMEMVSPDNPPLFIGPIYLGPNGNKMSKSRGNGIDIGAITSKKQIERLFKLQQEVIEQGKENVTYDSLQRAIHSDS